MAALPLTLSLRHAHPCSAHDAQLDVDTRVCRFAFYYFFFRFLYRFYCVSPTLTLRAARLARSASLHRTQSTRDGTVSAKPIARKQSVKMPTFTGAAERSGFSGFYSPVREKALGRGRTDPFSSTGLSSASVFARGRHFSWLPSERGLEIASLYKGIKE